jgi:hypothetical protein
MGWLRQPNLFCKVDLVKVTTEFGVYNQTLGDCNQRRLVTVTIFFGYRLWLLLPKTFDYYHNIFWLEVGNIELFSMFYICGLVVG